MSAVSKMTAFQPAAANGQMRKGLQLREFTCRCLQRLYLLVEGLHGFRPKEPSERAPKRKQEPFTTPPPTPLLLQWAREGVAVVLLVSE